MASNQTVTTINEGGKDTHESVVSWHRQMAEKGNIAANSARNRITALQSLVSVLGPEEPHDPQWVLDHLKEIAQRWATKNGVVGSTPETYMSKARNALLDYMAWKKDPTSFRPKTSQPKKEKPAKTNSKPEEVVESSPSMSSPPPPAQTQSPPQQLDGEVRSFPLDDDVFRFVLPKAGLTVSGAAKLALHLVTYARDFDPMKSSAREILAMMRVDVD